MINITFTDLSPEEAYEVLYAATAAPMPASMRKNLDYLAEQAKTPGTPVTSPPSATPTPPPSSPPPPAAATSQPAPPPPSPPEAAAPPPPPPAATENPLLARVVTAMEAYVKVNKVSGARKVLAQVGIGKPSEANQEQLAWLETAFQRTDYVPA